MSDEEKLAKAISECMKAIKASEEPQEVVKLGQVLKSHLAVQSEYRRLVKLIQALKE